MTATVWGSPGAGPRSAAAWDCPRPSIRPARAAGAGPIHDVRARSGILSERAAEPYPVRLSRGQQRNLGDQLHGARSGVGGQRRTDVVAQLVDGDRTDVDRRALFVL